MPKTDLRNSIGVRLLIVVLLTFLLLIPSIMIQSLVSERQQRRDTVSGEISRNWGAKQILVGPVLNIPYKCRVGEDQNGAGDVIGYAHFLPELLNVVGTVNPEVRNRGIYDIVVYACSLDVSATFGSPKFDALKVNATEVLWKDASLSFGISDMKGLKDPLSVRWNDAVVEASPGILSSGIGSSGVNIPVEVTPDKSGYAFQTKLNLNGSFDLLFSPIGKETNVHLSSPWRNPSFTGDYLPERRELNDKGFQADWRVLYVSRDFPQEWTGSRYEIDKSLFGVSLLLTVDQYQKTMRTVKYAIMFIALTFLTFFVIEILFAKPIHPMQYLLIGLALLVFYTLLLSLSEYMSFGYGYLLASTATVSLIAFYASSILADRRRSIFVAGVLIVLYGYLYIVLQLQDYALLMGSLVLFAALALVMYLTRRIDWFSLFNHRKTEP